MPSLIDFISSWSRSADATPDPREPDPYVIRIYEMYSNFYLNVYNNNTTNSKQQISNIKHSTLMVKN
jgi:hypothetical protein